MLGSPALESRKAITATKRLRVTMLGSMPPSKGISPYTAELVDALSALPEVDLEVLAFKSIYPSWLYPGGEPEHEDDGREFPNARVRRFITWYNPLTWIWAGLSLRGDVVHAQWWSYVLAPVYATVLAIARLRGKRVLITVHNVEPHENALLKRFLNRLVLRFADAFVVHSEANRASLEPGASAAVHVVPMGAHPARRSGVDRDSARRRLGLPETASVILNFGNIRPYKGVEVLIRAFAAVVKEHPEALLLIAGKPWTNWQPYQRLIDELGVAASVVTFLDYVPSDDIEVYFEAADVVVLPYTHFEAQSAVGALALPFGKPLIVTDVGGLPELVGRAEAVVRPGNADNLAAALVKVMRSPRLRRQMAADSARIAASLSWDSIGPATLETYQEVVRAA